MASRENNTPDSWVDQLSFGGNQVAESLIFNMINIRYGTPHTNVTIQEHPILSHLSLLE
jgi:hypothetical protein